MDEPKRTIVSIVWYPLRPDWYELTYDNGDYERVVGTLEDATALAEGSSPDEWCTRS
jgi:hypothetical protein